MSNSIPGGKILSNLPFAYVPPTLIKPIASAPTIAQHSTMSTTPYEIPFRSTDHAVRNHNSVGVKGHIYMSCHLIICTMELHDTSLYSTPKAHAFPRLRTFLRLRLLAPALSACSRALSPIIQEGRSMSEHPFGISYSMLHKCNKDCSAITCHYILLCMFSLSLPCPMRSYLV